MKNEINEVLDFIQRRFKDNYNWMNGNCYYFAIILKNKFPEGELYYDVINGHFVFFYQNDFYDWTGVIIPDGCYVEWDTFDEYDRFQKERIIRDCIM